MTQASVERFKEAEQLIATVIAILGKSHTQQPTTLPAQTLKKRLTELQRLRQELRQEVEQAMQVGTQG